MNQPTRRAHLPRHNAHHPAAPPQLISHPVSVRTSRPARHARQVARSRILRHIARPPNSSGPASSLKHVVPTAAALAGTTTVAAAPEDRALAAEDGAAAAALAGRGRAVGAVHAHAEIEEGGFAAES